MWCTHLWSGLTLNKYSLGLGPAQNLFDHPEDIVGSWLSWLKISWSIAVLWCHLSRCLDVKLVCKDSGNFLEDSCDAAILAEGEYSAHLLPQGPSLSPILPKELQSIIQGSPTMAVTSENLGNFLKIQIPELVPRLIDSKCLGEGGGISVSKCPLMIWTLCQIWGVWVALSTFYRLLHSSQQCF